MITRTRSYFQCVIENSPVLINLFFINPSVCRRRPSGYTAAGCGWVRPGRSWDKRRCRAPGGFQGVSALRCHVDWLINNVGISTYAKYEDYTFNEWTKIVNTNLSVPVFLVKELRPIMSEGGSILFTGSYAGQQAYSSSLVYGVTKSAIHFLTKSLVKELEPKQIRVNAIAPGFIETSWHKNRTPESYERINRKIALHRFGEISEVADMAYEVLKNGYMNGSVVDIHGGYDYF